MRNKINNSNCSCFSNTSDLQVTGNVLARQSSNCSCISMTGPTGASGSIGQTGLNAYEVAVENGFTGSQQEWLDSLIGATGPQIIAGGLVPYSAEAVNLSFIKYGNEQFYSTVFLTFFSEFFRREFYNFPTVFSNIAEDTFVESFTTSKPTLLTGLAFEINGTVRIQEGQNFVAKVLVFHSPSKDSNYYLIPESITNLSPILVEGQFIAFGINNFEFEVPANTKIVVAIILDSADVPQEDDSCNFEGFVWGSLHLKEV